MVLSEVQGNMEWMVQGKTSELRVRTHKGDDN